MNEEDFLPMLTYGYGNRVLLDRAVASIIERITTGREKTTEGRTFRLPANFVNDRIYERMGPAIILWLRIAIEQQRRRRKLQIRDSDLAEWLGTSRVTIIGYKRMLIELGFLNLNTETRPQVISVNYFPHKVQLRQAMRIAPSGGRDGLNDDGAAPAMESIRQSVGQFRHRLDAEAKLAADPLCRKLAEQIDKYHDKLFADPIDVQTPSGPQVVYPQRTNNILEQFFRSLRRDHRRRTGDNRMHRALQTMLADTPLVKNLSNPDYLKILLDGRPNIEALFADLDRTSASEELTPATEADRVLPGFF